MSAILSATGVTKRFGGLLAVDSLDLDVADGSITGLIGPNGAGKTTFFNCLMGLLVPDGGQARLGGDDLFAMEAHERARAGLGRTFQRLEVFSGMTVYDNLRVAAECANPGQAWRTLFRLRHRGERTVDETARRAVEAVGLARVADAVAADLPTGTLRLVELARALCTNPRVLLLDEPASGLDADETAQLEQLLHGIRERGVSILLVEHDVELVMAVSDYVYVLDFGKRIAAGTPAEVEADPAVQAAYLGVEEEVSGAAGA